MIQNSFMVKNSRLSLLVLTHTDQVTNYSCHIAAESIKNYVAYIKYILNISYQRLFYSTIRPSLKNHIKFSRHCDYHNTNAENF